MTFDDLIKSFKVQPTLNRDIWDENNQLHPKIRWALIRVAKSFYEGIDLENKPPIKDIVFTGSLANYNWSKFSDIDVHLLFDFKQYGEHQETFENLFLLAKSNWNNKHDVTVKGFEVEIYAEDEDNPHTSTGVYSILRNEWIKSPEKTTPVFDPLDVKSKAHYFIKLYRHIVQNVGSESVDVLLNRVEVLKDKIKRFRQAGLNKGGEYSTENLAFKALRRGGVLDKLYTLGVELADQQLSVSEINTMR